MTNPKDLGRPVLYWHSYKGEQVSRAQFAKFLEVSQRAVTEWVKEGKSDEWIIEHFEKLKRLRARRRSDRRL